MASATAAPELPAASDLRVDEVAVSAYEVPTGKQPETDGTLEWSSTTIVVVELQSGGGTGLGYTYASKATATAIGEKLASVVEGGDPFQLGAAWASMQEQVRNAGRPGAIAMAISAVDIALWDLKAKLLDVALADLLPRFHEAAPIYGSGGFTSYSLDRLRRQAIGWIESGFRSVKIKVGRDPKSDPRRLAAVREVIGPDVELMVDANGAWSRVQALEWMARLRADFGVTYVEEPVSSEDLAGLAWLRERAPAGMAVAAGEYAWNLPYLQQMLESDAVHILQADVTRVGGVTNMLRADALCKARCLPFSAHCAPAISAHVTCGMECLEHIEYFHDHVRIERLFFDGTLEPYGGKLAPDRSRPGLGLELKRGDVEHLRVS